MRIFFTLTEPLVSFLSQTSPLIVLILVSGVVGTIFAASFCLLLPSGPASRLTRTIRVFLLEAAVETQRERYFFKALGGAFSRTLALLSLTVPALIVSSVVYYGGYLLLDTRLGYRSFFPWELVTVEYPKEWSISSSVRPSPLVSDQEFPGTDRKFCLLRPVTDEPFEITLTREGLSHSFEIGVSRKPVPTSRIFPGGLKVYYPRRHITTRLLGLGWYWGYTIISSLVAGIIVGFFFRTRLFSISKQADPVPIF